MTTPEACKFRTWLPVAPGSHGTAKKHSFTVMTYNILCQKLIQRKLFPYANKTCLKRKQRNGKLLPEISHWKPDIACLQEVETEFWHTAMSPHFGRSNYESRFFQSLAKSHGVSISWKKQKFHIIDEVRVSMDISMEVNGEQLNTDNVALITVLGYGPGDEAVDPYADSVDPEYQIGTPKPDDAEEGGVIVSTAHLFWQPHACYERLQQQHAVMAALMELKAKYPNYHIIATGDYNTTPDDAGYDLLTKPRPVKLSEEQLENLLPFSVDDDDQEEGDKETADNGKPPAMSYAGVVAGSHDPSVELKLLEEERKLDAQLQQDIARVNSLVDLFQASYEPLRSAYGNYVDLDPTYKTPQWEGEPIYTNYAKWKGTLDYIFFGVAQQQDGQSSLELYDVLGLPPVKRLNPGLPNDLFPSDHVSLMARFAAD